jgi:protease I
MATSTLTGTRVAFLATDGVEAVEYTRPREAVEEAGATPVLVAPKPGSIQGVHGMAPGQEFAVERTLDEADPDDYDALVLPGGVANPDRLRTDPRAVQFARAFVDSGKPIGVICHGGWTLVEADAVEGLTLTSWPSLRTDLVNAGATWVDEEVHVDAGIVSSRGPRDLPAFCDKLVEEITEGVRSDRMLADEGGQT